MYGKYILRLDDACPTMDKQKWQKIEDSCDKYKIKPIKKNVFKWIPQQIWRFRKMPFGVWTGYFHPNIMSEHEIENLKLFLANNKNNFVNINELKYKNFSILNIIFKYLFLGLLKIKRKLNEKIIFFN